MGTSAMDQSRPSHREGMIAIAVALFLVAGVILPVKASHVVGTDFSYRCMGGDSMYVSINLYRDCSGLSAPSSLNFTFQSPCGAFSVNFPGELIGVVTPMCPEEYNNSTCFGGALPGIEHYRYTGIVELPPCPGGIWKTSFSHCCRNNANNVSPSAYYNEFEIYRDTGDCYDSPVFTAEPIPYFCNGVPANYNFEIDNTEGDSVFYALDTALSGAGLPAAYNSGYHGKDPFDVPVFLDSLTGQVQFTPATSGLWVIKVCASQYRNGAFIGKICRDVQFVVIDCDNYPPYVVPPGIVNFSGQGDLIGNNSIEACTGDTVRFEVFFADSLHPSQVSGSGDFVTLTSNIASVLPGAHFTISNGNPASVFVEWVAHAGTKPFKSIVINAADNACPIAGKTSAAITISVGNSPNAGPDRGLCRETDTAFFTGVSGSNLKWSVLSGDSIQPGVNFIDTVGLVGDSFWAYPSSTTIYRVTSDYTGNCGSDDTVTVFVSREFTVSAFGDTVICFNDASSGVPFGVVPDTASGSVPYNFSYRWEPLGDLDDPFSSTPVATPEIYGTKKYVVTVTSDSLCTATDSVTIDFHPPFPDSLRLDFEHDPLCLGDSTVGRVLFSAGAKTPCSGTDEPCSGSKSTTVAGSDQKISSSLSPFSPYPNREEGARIQYLYTPQDLGVSGSGIQKRINSISFDVQALNGIPSLEDYQIKIGCTSDTGLSGGWIENLTTVYHRPSYTVQPGINQHVFDTLYEYDGVSNLVVEICFYNSGTAKYGVNASVKYSEVPGKVVYRMTESNSSTICASTLVTSSGYERPNTEFGFCYSFDPQDYVYNWQPPGSVFNPQSDSAVVFPDSSENYTVTIENADGTCAAEVVKTLEVVTEYDASFSFTHPLCLDSDPDTAEVTTPGGIFSGTGIIDSVVGVFDPSGLSHDTFDISYTLVSPSGNCFTSDTAGVPVVPPPPTQFSGPERFCTGADTVYFQGFPENGVWRADSGVIDSLTGALIPSTLPGHGSYAIIYERKTSCARTDTLTVRAYLPPTARLDSLFEVCNNDSFQLFADTVVGAPYDSLPPRFNWFGPGVADSAAGIVFPDTLSPGIYTVNLQLTDSAEQCSDTVSGNYRVLPSDTPRILDPLEFCADAGTIAVNVSPQFNADSGSLTADPVLPNIDTLDFGNSNVFSTIPYDSGSWELSYHYTNGFGCTAFATDTLTILPIPGNPDITPNGFCAGGEIILRADSSGIDSVYWFIDALHLPHSPAGRGFVFNGGIAEEGRKRFYVMVGKGECVSEPMVHDVEALQHPEARFELDYETFSRETERVVVTHAEVSDERGYPVPGRKVLSAFAAEVFGRALEPPIPDTDTVHWNFDYNSTSVPRSDAWVRYRPEAGYEYVDPGIFRIEMIRVNQFGCADSTFMLIELIDGEVPPNVFTPNGDGVNDEFILRSALGIENFNLSIYNRWGVLVWEVEHPVAGWDGRTFSGEEVSDGVYYFIAAGNYPNGAEYVRKGSIQLMR